MSLMRTDEASRPVSWHHDWVVGYHDNITQTLDMAASRPVIIT